MVSIGFYLKCRGLWREGWGRIIVWSFICQPFPVFILAGLNANEYCSHILAGQRLFCKRIVGCHLLMHVRFTARCEKFNLLHSGCCLDPVISNDYMWKYALQNCAIPVLHNFAFSTGAVASLKAEQCTDHKNGNATEVTLVILCAILHCLVTALERWLPTHTALAVGYVHKSSEWIK